MNKQFDVVEQQRPNRNGFDLSHTTTTSMNMAQLAPVSIMEVIPGDKFTIGAECLVRFLPMVAPVMHRFDARIEYFFVPNRLVWDNWNTFLTNQPGAVGSPAVPTVSIHSGNYTRLHDYMGIPAPIGAEVEIVNAMPIAAYQLIYDQYFKDQNVMVLPSTAYTLVNGDNTATIGALSVLRHRSWEHDQFTSCLPFAQKGNPVTLGNAVFDDVAVNAYDPAAPGPGFYNIDSAGGAILSVAIENSPTIADNLLYADTSELESFAITVNDMREAVSLQKWLEINARAGTRINEVIQGHFGVKSSDARLQRPEYIVGVKTPISISEVLNTSSTIDEPQGTMAGHGIAAITDKNFGSYYAEEHGFIIGIMTVMPKTSYQQGLAKHWLKTNDITDYFWPTMANIGEQPLLNKEVYAYQGGTGNDTFGYMPAYYDYRTIQNRITSAMKSSLSYWTCSRIFDEPPALNEEFIRAVPRKDIFAVTDPNEDCMVVQVSNKVFASRLIPEYGTPGIPTL